MIRYILLLISLYTFAVAEQNIYEPIAKSEVCKQCHCDEGIYENIKADQLVIDCSLRNFKHLFPNWPDHILMNKDDIEGQLSHYTDYRKDIIVSFSGNSINVLEPLPPSEAQIQFNCRHCNLTDIVSGAFLNSANIVRLDLSYNKLTADVLKPETFRGRYNEHQYEPISLIDLDLSFNQISSLDSQLFIHTPNITRLSLQHNPFNGLDSNTVKAITSLQHIEHLNLANIGISDLARDLLEPLHNLKVLVVYGNNFVTVPESLAYSRRTLMSLYIGDNPIEQLNSNSFLGLSGLTHLNMSGLRKLTEIQPETFSSLKSIEVLKAFGNTQLIRFDLTSLAKLPQLRDLDITSCGLNHLEINVSNTTNTLTENKESTLNEDSDGSLFPNLRILKLENNPWFCNCELLRHLRQLDYYKTSQNHESEVEARCSAPYELSGTLLMDLVDRPVCNITEIKKPRIPVYDPPQYLRPRSIAITIISVIGVVLLGLLIGFGIVLIKRKLRDSDFGFASPVRYTTVRESTMPVVNTVNI